MSDFNVEDGIRETFFTGQVRDAQIEALIASLMLLRRIGRYSMFIVIGLVILFVYCIYVMVTGGYWNTSTQLWLFILAIASLVAAFSAIGAYWASRYTFNKISTVVSTLVARQTGYPQNRLRWRDVRPLP